MASDPSAIAIEMSLPSLPEGWKGTPNQLLTWITENAIFKASGASLTGQVGGATPVTDVGIFIDGTEIKVWSSTLSKYVPLLTVPVGGVMDWPSTLLSPPTHYLFCEGQLLTISSYPDLYAVLGSTYNKPTDAATTNFRLPNFLGRVGVGAGDAAGEYNPSAVGGAPSGPMVNHTVGEYFGAEWPSYRIAAAIGTATPRYGMQLYGDSPLYVWNKTYFNGVTQPSLGVRKIIRAE